MTRVFILFTTLALFISGLKSQTIVITFEGTVNGAPTALDSILVMNLTQGGDTTIYFPDNELVLGSIVTGISAAGTPGFAMQALPNPFAGSTEVVLDAVGGEALLTLHDVAGRELVSQAANLAAGTRRFRVSCERPGVHLLTVTQGGVRSSLRLVATEGACVAGLSLVGGSDRGAPKSDRSLFTWTPGDELRYIGYATSGEVSYIAAIDEVPDASATRTFVMAVGGFCPGSPTVTDINGNTYPVVQIGNQCWMASNLLTASYANGDPISNVTDGDEWGQLTTGAWAHIGNESQYDNPYGKLYNWYAVADPRNVCPAGWHVPADGEWQQLELALGMQVSELSITGIRGLAQNVGGKMKSTTLWNPPNTGATNESGFSGLPGGIRLEYGPFENFDYVGYWWSASASESASESAWARSLGYGDAGLYRNDVFTKRLGFSVRCVRD